MPQTENTKKKILIVDDDQLILKALVEHFDREGYKTAVAGNGDECLRIVKKFKPDLIILDIIMPKMDGLTALRKLKANSATANVPVVILTNVDTKESLAKALEAGSYYYFLKINYSAAALSKKVKEILWQGKGGNKK